MDDKDMKEYNVKIVGENIQTCVAAKVRLY